MLELSFPLIPAAFAAVFNGGARRKMFSLQSCFVHPLWGLSLQGAGAVCLLDRLGPHELILPQIK